MTKKIILNTMKYGTKILQYLKDQAQDKIIINISKDTDYYKQINNEIVPLSSCNVTSCVMAILNSKNCKMKFPKNIRPADYLSSKLRESEAYEIQKKLAPNTVNKYAPQEVHAVLEYYMNMLLTKGTWQFTTSISTKVLVYQLVKGYSSVLSGRFNGYGHIVCLSGVITKQKNIRFIKKPDEVMLDQIESFIIDDPYGDYHIGYESHEGNNIIMSMKDFKSMLHRRNTISKWAHLINYPYNF